jgi:phosphatidyl-myo-inositol dimannoside synthase
LEKIIVKLVEYHPRNLNLVTVGRLHYRKGHVFVFNILKNLSNYKKLLKYRILGPQTSRKYADFLIKSSAKLNIKLTFKYDIQPQDLEKEYFESDIFIMLSLTYKKSVEGFGLVYSEAGLKKIPVIASLIGGTDNAILANYTGLINYKYKIHSFFKNILFLKKKFNFRRVLGF